MTAVDAVYLIRYSDKSSTLRSTHCNSPS